MNGETLILIVAAMISALVLLGVLWRVPLLRPTWRLELRQLKYVLVLVAVWMLGSGGLTIVGFESAGAIIRRHLRAQVALALQEHSGLCVDDNSIPDPIAREMMLELAELRFVAGHHSHTLSSYLITINTRPAPLILRVSQDSEYGREFWVYWPNFSNTLSIGRIEAPILERKIARIPFGQP